MEIEPRSQGRHAELSAFDLVPAKQLLHVTLALPEMVPGGLLGAEERTVGRVAISLSLPDEEVDSRAVFERTKLD